MNAQKYLRVEESFNVEHINKKEKFKEYVRRFRLTVRIAKRKKVNYKQLKNCKYKY
jgi:hypothetical protein